MQLLLDESHFPLETCPAPQSYKLKVMKPPIKLLLDKMNSCSCVSFYKICKPEIIHVTSMCKYKLDNDWLGCSTAVKNLGVTVGQKLNIYQECALTGSTGES